MFVIVIFIGMTFAEDYFEYFEKPLQNEIYVRIPNDFDTSLHDAVKNGIHLGINKEKNNRFDNFMDVCCDLSLHIKFLNHFHFLFRSFGQSTRIDCTRLQCQCKECKPRNSPAHRSRINRYFVVLFPI